MTQSDDPQEEPSFLDNVFRKDRPFWASTWGQRFLLVLSPFLFLPHEAGQGSLKELFDNLRTGFLSPIFGALFLTSSLIVTLKAYQKLGIHFEWLVDFGSGKFFIGMAILLSLSTYNAAFARWLAPVIAELFTRDKSIPQYSFQFWAIRYGGLLVFSGFVGWIFTGITWFNLPLWAFFLMTALLASLLYLARKEINFQHQRLHIALPTQHASLLRTLEITFFSLAAGCEVLIYLFVI